MRKKRSNASSEVAEGDLTPMIDMTFQLIAFFMVLINFSQAEQNQAIQLPDSTLAKPAEQPLEFPVTIHVAQDGDAIIGGQKMAISALGPVLNSEQRVLRQLHEGKEPTVIIRGDMRAQTGKIQELIKICQENKFEKFALRAKHDVGND